MPYLPRESLSTVFTVPYVWYPTVILEFQISYLALPASEIGFPFVGGVLRESRKAVGKELVVVEGDPLCQSAATSFCFLSYRHPADLL
jgi:hypothetical protein